MGERGSYAKGIAKREEILRAALEVFSRKGYLKTSIRELADAAGLSHSGLLHYFESKEELLVGILRKRDEKNRERYDVESGDVDRLLRVISANAQVPGLAQLFATMSSAASDENHPAHEFFLERYNVLRDEIAHDVRKRQARGELRGDLEPSMIATILLAVADGLQIQWLVSPDRDMSKHIEYLWQLLHELDPRPNAPA